LEIIAMFGRLFGASNKGNTQKAPPADLNTSIQKLRQAIQTLDKREEHLEKRLLSQLPEPNKNRKIETKKEHCLN